MTQVAILTPNPAFDHHQGLWRTVLDRLRAALQAVGIEAVPTPWTSHVEDASALARYARVLPLLAWGYHTEHARWLQACRAWEAAGIAMSNPASVIAWNSDKRYLEELARKGVAMPHTRFTDRLDRDLVREMLEELASDELIVKPAVSGGAWNTRRVRRGSELDATFWDGVAGMHMLVQPYLPTIESEGETSLLFFGGELSHVVNKRPLSGDFRVQEEFGGVYTSLDEPPAGALALAEKTFAAIGTPLLYARMDMVPDADGHWLLMEAELVEPDFYLGVDPGHGAAFAQALARLVSPDSP